MRKNLKNIIMYTSFCTIFSLGTLSTTALAQPVTSNDTAAEEIKDTISQNITIEKKEIKLNNKSDLTKTISDSDLLKFNQLAKSQGIEKIYTKDELINLYDESIAKLNQNIKDENLELLKDGSVIDANDDSFYLQGGSTFEKKYWWGVSIWKSTQDATAWTAKINSSAIANSVTGLGAGLISKWLAIPNSLASTYGFAFTNRVNYVNSLSDRGIVADINWALVYSVYNQ